MKPACSVFNADYIIAIEWKQDSHRNNELSQISRKELEVRIMEA